MDGVENFKISDVQQARLINNYENTKYKPLKTNAPNGSIRPAGTIGGRRNR